VEVLGGEIRRANGNVIGTLVVSASGASIGTNDEFGGATSFISIPPSQEEIMASHWVWTIRTQTGETIVCTFTKANPKSCVYTSTSTPIPNSLLDEISISINQGDIPNYERSDWKHWTDSDNDCQNTRHEVLIEESSKEVEFKDDKYCQVLKGVWIDLFTGKEYSDPSKLDIDHMVPLKNVHISGGWDWSSKRKELYANDLNESNHLIAVSASANRSKGSKGPEDWRPSNKDYWCEYATDWMSIKIKWELTVTNREFNALTEMLNTCSN